jgi:polyphosphate kinase
MYCSSADWMERNLQQRIEIAFPILKKKAAARILEELEMYLADRRQSWELLADGTYQKHEAGPDDPTEGVQSLLLTALATHATATRL